MVDFSLLFFYPKFHSELEPEKQSVHYPPLPSLCQLSTDQDISKSLIKHSNPFKSQHLPLTPISNRRVHTRLLLRVSDPLSIMLMFISRYWSTSPVHDHPHEVTGHHSGRDGRHLRHLPDIRHFRTVFHGHYRRQTGQFQGESIGYLHSAPWSRHLVLFTPFTASSTWPGTKWMASRVQVHINFVAVVGNGWIVWRFLPKCIGCQRIRTEPINSGHLDSDSVILSSVVRRLKRGMENWRNRWKWKSCVRNIQRHCQFT